MAVLAQGQKAAELASSELSMVAELLKRGLLVTTLGFLSGNLGISGSLPALILWNMTMHGQKGIQPSIFEGGLDDLESFQAWAEEIKTYISSSNPALYDVLGQTAVAKDPIDEAGLAKASEDVLKEKHKALRLLQAKVARANMTQQELAAAGAIDEEAPPEADPKSEFEFQQELASNKLQVQNEGRQLGYLLVQKTKGETQLQLRRWISSTNGWEAWRQLNLLHTTSKRSTHFKLLSSLMSPSFDTQPASFLQQYNAWKEQTLRYQQLSGEHLPDFIKLTAVVNGLKGQVRHHVLMQLDGGSTFGDLDSLLQKYFNNTYVQSESSLNSVWDKAWRENQASKGKGKGKNKKLSNPHYKQDEGKPAKGKGKGKSKGKGKPQKGKGEAYQSQPAAPKGKGKQQLPKAQQWCSICFKKGHLAQACWWNPDPPQQQQQQHQKGAAWPTQTWSAKGQQQQAWGQQPWPQQTSSQWLGGNQAVQWLGGPQPQLYSLNQPATYTSLPPDNQSMLSLEPPSQASTQPVHSAPVFAVACQKKSFQPFSKASKTWGILVDTGAATSVAPKSFAQHIELSPAPPTLQLTTANGKAIETFGVRRVHLQTSGLSFEVAFVIADVVTPLLGLDALLHESLSLHLGHDSGHFLVASGGERTQLQHKGKHLYLIACPSKPGSSHHLTCSLSNVVGFLPSDMQLDHDDALSLSSSSTDLVGDLVPQEASLEDSWNLHCHPVFEEASEDDSEPSFDLVPGREEVADAGGEPHGSFRPAYLRQPKQPSKQERELHNMTHIPFQPWCVVCQEAKGRASQHRKKQASTKTSKIQLDYAYIRQPQEKEPTTILTWVESLTGLAGSLMTTKKGVTQAQLDAVITFIKRQGFSQSTLQSDGEPALVKLVEEIGKQTSLPVRHSPAYSHQSQAYVEGWHRSLFAQFRALLFDFCHRYQLEPSEVKMGGSFSQHMLRHAVWLLNRFQLHTSDQKTSFQRRWGVPFSNPVLPFGELVLAQTQHAESAKLDHRLQPQRSLAIWLGRCEATGEHILAKANNTSLVKSRTVTRLSLEEACKLSTFKTISIPAPELSSSASVKMAKEGDQPTDQTGGEAKLRLDVPPQAFTQPPQQRPRGRPKLQPAPFQPALVPPPGLAQPSTSTSLPQPASQPAALQPKAQQPPPPPPALQQPALQQQPVRRRIMQKGPGPAATKLHSILEKARSLHELEVAVNASEEELQDAKEALKDVHLQAYYEDDLSLFAAEDIKRAMLKEGESLRGTYDPVSKASFTKQQLKGVIQTRWVVQPRPAADGDTSLRARFVAKGFKQQIMDPSLETYASTPSHLSLRILLILSLVNHWDVVSADISSAFLQAPIPEGELVLVKPPPELEQDPDVLWKLRKALYGLKTSPKLWQQHLSDKLQALGLTKNKADPCIFQADKLLVMTYVDDLLIVGEKLAQESFLAKLSAMFPLKHQTKLDAQTPLTFLGKLVEYNQQEHSISLHLPTAYYQKLFKLYGMEQAKPSSTTGDKLGRNDDPADPLNQPLDPARHKLYRTAVGKLLWATPVRPDISFAVKELSRSLQSPTQQNEKELKHVLRYLKGSLQYTTCLKPPRKRVVEQASTIEIQAFADSDWAGCAKTRKSTSGASLALWGVTIATSSRTQATQALSSAEAELYAMGMAIQDALHLQSLLQELKLTQLAKPFELTVYTDSSSGKALASKLGLTRKSKHVQLRFLFMQDLVANGQLKLSRVPSEKNPADVLTKYLQASTLHKLLPKLGVVTRALDSKDLLSMVSFGGQVSSEPFASSFFIGMLAESHASAQLVASRAYSRQSLPGSLRLERQEDQPAAPSTPTSFSWSSFVWFSVCFAALLGLPFFFVNFDFKLYGALLSSMMVAVQLVLRASFLLQQVAFRTRVAASAFRTLSSVAWGSLRTTKSLNRILLVSFLLAQLALLVQKRSLIMSASFAQNESFESFNSLQPSFCFGSLCFSPASALTMSMSSAASAASVLGAPPGASAAAASSFTHEEAVMMQLQNEAFALPEALLDHTLKAKLCNKMGEAYPPQLPAETFKLAVPKLDKQKLRFWLLLHEEAFTSFKDAKFKQLPQQRCAGTNNANLGNFQASSSFSKQVAFYAWIVNRHEKLTGQEAYMISLDILPESFVWSANFMQLKKTVSLDYRASDTQLCFWGKLDPNETQPDFEKLGVEVGSLVWKLGNFTELSKHLYHTASFDWGAASSEWQLAKNWRKDSLQHAEVYWKLQENLGSASPLGKLIRAHFAEAWKEPAAASGPAASALAASSVAAFWENEAELANEHLQKTLSKVKALLAGASPLPSLEAAASEEELPDQQPASKEEPSGRFDGSEASLASGFGNQPLSLKLVLAEGLQNFKL